MPRKRKSPVAEVIDQERDQSTTTLDTPYPPEKSFVEIAGNPDALFTEGHAERVKRKREIRGEGFQRINLTDDNDGPHMRLIHDRQGHQFKILFSEKPDPDTIQHMRDEGFSFGRAGDGTWVIGYGEGNLHRAQAHSIRVFNEVGNELRMRNGLEPASSFVGEGVG